MINHQTEPSLKIPDRFLLAGVPQVGFYNGGNRCPENVPFPSCLRAILDYTGEGLGYSLISTNNTTWRLDRTYTFLMGVSGCAFRLSWLPGWSLDNVEIMYMSDDAAAPFSRALEAFGYQMELPASPEDPQPDVKNREAILHNLVEKELPVIAFGIIGPPEACLVTGFEENGEILIGWNFFQHDPAYNAGVEFEPTGEFRKRGWSLGPQALLALGARKEIPDQGEIYRSTLVWALQVMRTPLTFGERHNGIAAFQAWVDHLLMEDAFPAGDLEILRQRFLVHDCVVGMLAEGRWYAAKFLEMVVETELGIEDDLLSAAACFEEEHNLMWRVWGLVGGNGQSTENVLRLADPAVRRVIVPLILRARDKDVEAARFIETALNRFRNIW